MSSEFPSASDMVLELERKLKIKNEQSKYLNDRFNKLYNIIGELKKIRDYQKHSDYELKCPDLLKAEYDANIILLVDELISNKVNDGKDLCTYLCKASDATCKHHTIDEHMCCISCDHFPESGRGCNKDTNLECAAFNNDIKDCVWLDRV